MAHTVLQVEATWPDGRIDVLHLPGSAGEVTLSDEVGWHWSILGVPLGFVPASLAPWLRWSPPLLAEVAERPRGAFLVPRDDLGAATRGVWTVREGVAVAHVDPAWQPEVRVDGRTASWDELVRHGRVVRGDEGWEVLLTRGVELRFTVGPARFRCLEVDAMAGVGRAAPEPWLPLIGTLGWLALAALLALLPRTAPPETELALELPHEPRVMLAEVPPPPPPPPPTRRGGKAGGGSQAAPTPGGGGGGRSEAQGAGLGQAFDTILGDLGGVPGDLYAQVGRLRHGGGGPGRPGGSALGPRNGLGGGGEATGLGDWPGGGPRRGAGPPGSGRGKDPGTGPRTQADPIVLGSLTRAEVDAVIKRKLGAMRFCYTRALRGDPTLAGKVVLVLDVAADGSVSRARVDDASLGDPSVGRCIEALLYRLVFPVPRGGGSVGVRYPLLFTPAG